MSHVLPGPRLRSGDRADRQRDVRADRARGRPRAAAAGARVRGLGGLGRDAALAGPGRAGDHVHALGAGRDGRVPPPVHASQLQDDALDAGRPGGAGFDLGRGAGDRMGGTHRKHHNFSDQPGDPHSPHVDQAAGWRGAVRGLAHAHVGWMFRGKDMANPRRYAKDLLADRDLRVISRLFPLWVVVGLAVPFGLGIALTGTLVGGLTGLLWGGVVRVMLLHHATFCINSLCHFFGRRPFATGDESRNLAWLAPFAFGEAWHNNHHAFPTSARHGLGRWQFDPERLADQRARTLPPGLGRRAGQHRAPAGQASGGRRATRHVASAVASRLRTSPPRGVHGRRHAGRDRRAGLRPGRPLGRVRVGAGAGRRRDLRRHRAVADRRAALAQRGLAPERRGGRRDRRAPRALPRVEHAGGRQRARTRSWASPPGSPRCGARRPRRVRTCRR